MLRVASLMWVFLVSFLAKAQIAANYEVATWRGFKSSAVSYTFDDNCSSQIPVAIPLFDKYGFKTTFFTVTTSGTGFAPNWNSLKTVSANGHEVSSHTVTHSNLNTASISSQDAELKNSQSTIISNLPTTKCQTIAYPNCNTGDVATIQKYYIAGRICSGQIIAKTPTDFYNLSSIICGSTGVNTANDMNTRAANAKSANGWCVFLLHGIDSDGGYSPLSSSVLSSHLSYMNTNVADFWVATFANVVKYIKERNAINLTETTITADSLKLVPTDNLDNTVYDAAITIRRKLPPGWTDAKVYSGNSLIASSIVTVNNVKYVMFEVISDKGNYFIANKTAGTNNCATPAPTATASIAYDLGAISSPLTASGASLKWYTVETGGTASNTAPTPSTTTVGSTTYYVSQTLNGCEGPRKAIVVTVENIFKIQKTSTIILIDGIVDAAWNNAGLLPISATKLLSGAVSNSADLSGNLKAMWDQTNLYVLAEITDDTKINESTNAYDDDAVEVYVDINNDKAATYGTNDVQYTFGWNDGTTVGTLPSGRSVTGITYSSVSTTNGYVIEAKIPWSTVQGTPSVGQFLGFDFMINDDDNNGARDGKLSWNASADNAWQDPSLFGTAKLADDIVTGFEDSKENNRWVCFPNPFTNELNVNLEGTFEYSFQSISGENLISGTAIKNIPLETELPQGVYFLTISQAGFSKILKVCK